MSKTQLSEKCSLECLYTAVGGSVSVRFTGVELSPVVAVGCQGVAMERDVRHPSLFTLCGLVLCLMFMGNLAKASEPLAIYLNMTDFTSQYMGVIQVYDEPQSQSDKVSLRVYPGAIRIVDVNRGEWLAINVSRNSVIFPCKDSKNEHRIQAGKGAIAQAVIVTPRVAVEGDKPVCRLEIVVADHDE